VFDSFNTILVAILGGLAWEGGCARAVACRVHGGRATDVSTIFAYNAST